jgi:hypothetical protein
MLSDVLTFEYFPDWNVVKEVETADFQEQDKRFGAKAAAGAATAASAGAAGPGQGQGQEGAVLKLGLKRLQLFNVEVSFCDMRYSAYEW